MKYLRKFESFESQGEESNDQTQRESEITNVDAILDELSKETGVEISKDSLEEVIESPETNENKKINEEFFPELWSEMTTLVYNPETVEYDTVSGTGALGWFATILSSLGLIGSLRYAGKGVVAFFKRDRKEKDVSITWREFCKETGTDKNLMNTLNPETEEGKKVLANFTQWAKEKA